LRTAPWSSGDDGDDGDGDGDAAVAMAAAVVPVVSASSPMAGDAPLSAPTASSVMRSSDAAA